MLRRTLCRLARYVRQLWRGHKLVLAVGLGLSSAQAQSPFPSVVSQASVSIAITTAANTKLVTAVSGKAVYITNYLIVANGTGNFQLVYGTGTNCATGQTALTGALNLVAGSIVSTGNGMAPIIVVPQSVDVCAVTSAAVNMSGSIAYAQF